MSDTSHVPEPGGASETQLAEAVTKFSWDGRKLEPGIALALSGGGFRAMLFHAGALMRFNELGLLSKTSRISSVSGGSIAAGHLAAVWPKLGAPDEKGIFGKFKDTVVAPLFDFSRRNLDIKNAVIGLLPFTSAASRMAKSYENHLLGRKTLREIADKPVFVFCATNLQTGVLWRFSKAYAGDYIVGRLDKPDFLLAEVVAASSAFPPILSPMKFSPAPGSFTDWPSSGGNIPVLENLSGFRETVILSDGGVYDNHGLEPVLKRYMTVFVSDGGAPFGRSASIGWDWLRQLHRILGIVDNQVRALRRRDLIARFGNGNRAFASGSLPPNEVRDYERMGAYWGIDTDPAKMTPPDALPCDGPLTDELARLSTRLSDLGETRSKQLINWGYAICDRSVRTHYRGPVPPQTTKAVWPYPEAPL